MADTLRKELWSLPRGEKEMILTNGLREGGYIEVAEQTIFDIW